MTEITEVVEETDNGPIITLLDRIRATDDIIDAQLRDDGIVEAVRRISDVDEVLEFYALDEKYDEPFWLHDTDLEPEMYKLHRRLNIWLHSHKTNIMFKKTNGYD